MKCQTCRSSMDDEDGYVSCPNEERCASCNLLFHPGEAIPHGREFGELDGGTYCRECSRWLCELCTPKHGCHLAENAS